MTHIASPGRVTGEGLDLAFREWNIAAGGVPIVLLHGIGGSSADWSATVRHLPRQRVVAFDARGHGESDWDPEEAYGGDQHFADLATALSSLGIARCILAGFSMGGGIAMLTAAALPEQVSGVVVVDTYPHPRMTPGSRRIAGWVSSFAEHGASFDPAIARHFRTLLESGEESRLDLTSMWEAIACPSLVVRGAMSDVLPADVADEMVRLQPRARLATIDGVAHSIPWTKPVELAALIEEFASGLG